MSQLSMWVQSENGPWLHTATLSEGWGKVVVLKVTVKGNPLDGVQRKMA